MLRSVQLAQAERRSSLLDLWSLRAQNGPPHCYWLGLGGCVVQDNYRYFLDAELHGVFSSVALGLATLWRGLRTIALGISPGNGLIHGDAQPGVNGAGPALVFATVLLTIAGICVRCVCLYVRLLSEGRSTIDNRNRAFAWSDTVRRFGQTPAQHTAGTDGARSSIHVPQTVFQTVAVQAAARRPRSAHAAIEEGGLRRKVHLLGSVPAA